MKERPILFSGPMVRAILEGRKTQTRRVVKQVPHWQHCGKDIMEWWLSGCYTDDDGRHWLDIQTDVDDNSHEEIKCPYGVAGDRLWVRETHSFDGCACYEPCSCPKVWYRADMPAGMHAEESPKWRPSIHMPRWASRIDLELTFDVRLERVQDISEADAFAEGISGGDWLGDPVGAFAALWDSINGNRYQMLESGERLRIPCAWADNPWVWRVEFGRVQP